MFESGIYRIVNTLNNTTYIGSSYHIPFRLHEHWRRLVRNRHPNPHLQSAWNKYGEVAFIFEPLVECLPMALAQKEQEFIDSYYEHGLPLYNIRPSYDSQVGFSLPQETRQKISATLTGRKLGPRTPETREKIRQALLGKKHTPERRVRLGASRKGKPLTQEHKNKIRAGWAAKRIQLLQKERTNE